MSDREQAARAAAEAWLHQAGSDPTQRCDDGTLRADSLTALLLAEREAAVRECATLVIDDGSPAAAKEDEMLSETQKERVRELWSELDDGEVSTERLFAMVGERASREMRKDVDDGDISEALSASR